MAKSILSIGQVLDRSIELIKKDFGQILLIGLILNLPNIAFSIFVTLFSHDIQQNPSEIGPIILMIVTLLIGFILMMVVNNLYIASIVNFVKDRAKGLRQSTLETVKKSVRQLIPIILASMAVTLLVFFAGMPFVVTGLGLGIYMGGSVPSIILVVLFILIGNIVGLIIWCGFYFYAQVIVVENLGAMACLRRSWDLSKNIRFKIFLLFVLIYIAFTMVLIPQGFLGILFEPIEGAPTIMESFDHAKLKEASKRPQTINYFNLVFINLVSLVSMSIAGAFMAVASTMAYFQVRNAKEGVGLLEASRG